MSADKPKPITVVNVMSRKGGVGKTSIALSAALQLAADGNRVAFIEMDTLGSHLSQHLPLDRDVDVVRGKLTMRPLQGGEGLLPYSKRPYLVWRYIDRHIEGNRRPPTPDEVKCQLQLPASVLELAAEENLEEAVQRARDNCHLFPMSPWLRDVDKFHRLFLTGDAQEAVLREFDRTLDSFSDDYDFLIFDHTPGLCFGSALGLSWIFRLNRREEVQARLWLVQGPPWYELPPLGYEINIYSDQLDHVHPLIVCNSFLARTLFGRDLKSIVRKEEIRDLPELRDRISDRFFGVPMWMSTEFSLKRLFDQYVVPTFDGMAYLFQDDQVARSVMTSEDACAESLPEGEAEPESPERIQKVWCGWAERYLREFVVAAVRARAQVGEGEGQEVSWGEDGRTPGMFHRSVRRTLIGDLESRRA